MTDPFAAYAGLILTWVECLAFLLGAKLGARPAATRNNWAGIRIEATMVSDDAWRAGHRAALPQATMACLALLPASLIAIFFVNQAVLPITVLEWAFMAAGLVWILVAARTAARAARGVSGLWQAEASTVSDDPRCLRCVTSRSVHGLISGPEVFLDDPYRSDARCASLRYPPPQGLG